MRTGLEYSLNVVAGRLLLSDRVGTALASEYLQRLGIPQNQINLDGHRFAY